MKTLRRKEKLLNCQVNDLKAKLASNSVEVSQSLDAELKTIMNANEIKEPFARLFWEQQQKAFSSKKGAMKWHPMMIRLAIMLQSQSPATYATLRETGVLKLPGKSTLRDYTNVFNPQQGFNPEVLREIKEAAKGFKEHERYVALLHDEMTIKTDLVFDRRSGEMVGFLRPNQWDVGSDCLATHALVFMVVGINTNLKMSLGFFGTKTSTAADLFSLLWAAVGYLETTCKLKVLD